MNQLGFCFEAIPEAAPIAQPQPTPTPAVDYIGQYRQLLERHHEFMLAGNENLAMSIRKEANRLAREMNGGPGILASDDAAGEVLMRETAAPEGIVPLWGQQGNFIITVGEMRVRIEQDGLLDIGGGCGFWLGFSAHAVDWNKPFISDTGFRSFLGYLGEPAAGMTPDKVAEHFIRANIQSNKGKLQRIDPGYAERALARLKGDAP